MDDDTERNGVEKTEYERALEVLDDYEEAPASESPACDICSRDFRTAPTILKGEDRVRYVCEWCLSELEEYERIDHERESEELFDIVDIEDDDE